MPLKEINERLLKHGYWFWKELSKPLYHITVPLDDKTVRPLCERSIEISTDVKTRILHKDRELCDECALLYGLMEGRYQEEIDFNDLMEHVKSRLIGNVFNDSPLLKHIRDHQTAIANQGRRAIVSIHVRDT